MFDYNNLKNSYIATIQMGIMLNTSYQEARHGNEVVHGFCKHCIEHSDYSENDKQAMKNDLEAVKKLLSDEIEIHYQGLNR